MKTISEKAGKLSLEIRAAVGLAVGLPLEEIQVNPQSVENMLSSTWWSGAKSKMSLLSPGGELIVMLKQDYARLAQGMFGVLISNTADITKAIEEKIGKPPGKDVMKQLKALPITMVCDYLTVHQQREEVRIEVDMFATDAGIVMTADGVLVKLTHRPFEVQGVADEEVIADFKEHFPELDAFLDFIVASRFVIDRKQCYLWMHADSDWGKNLLMDQFKILGSSTTMTVKETEAAFEGKPVGLSTVLFRRSFILTFDEFKTVKAEMKQLQNELTINPKNQLRATVDIFTKVFMSKESVHSLVGDHGIESQFANRFTYLKLEGTVNSRPLFIEKGRRKYALPLRHYIATRLNALVDAYIAMGADDADTAGYKAIDLWWDAHAIGNHFQNFSETLPAVATEFAGWVLQQYRFATRPEYATSTGADLGMSGIERQAARIAEVNLFEDAQWRWCLKQPGKLFELWLNDKTEFSGKASLNMARDDVYKHMSADGKGCVCHRAGELVYKGIHLKTEFSPK